ncbi:MAG: hypothetical protein NUW23_07795, partial [Firmicutes bacterium]|nr:hypothetical protein [Bacillota bacterium]
SSKQIYAQIIDDEKGATLVASVPGSPGLIRVIRDGRRIWEGIDRGAEVRLPGPGVYRVEVERIVLGRYRPWIYGNHFFLR